MYKVYVNSQQNLFHYNNNNNAINPIYSRNNELSHINNNIIYRNNSLINNFNQNQINIRPQINNNLDNFPHPNNLSHENNFVPHKEEEKEALFIRWLAKQKLMNKINNMHKNEKCSICHEEINGNISIAKCRHIFHYRHAQGHPEVRRAS